MVTGAGLLLPFAAVIALWFAGTGLVAMIHHRLRQSFARSLIIAAICAFAGLALIVLSLGAMTANPTGAYAFALLLIFRLSSKLNIYRGVPHLSDELLPAHLGYLKSFFGPRSFHAVLALSIFAIIGLAGLFAISFANASSPGAAAQAGLLCCLSLLAALEHLFFAVPFRDSALWGWALGPRDSRDLGEGVKP
jgi:hypothetical protein